MDITVTKSNKGKDKIVLDGYVFHLEKTYKENFRWICEKKKHFLCKGRISTQLNIKSEHFIIKGPSEHNHDPLSHKKEVYKTNYHIKRSAEVSDKRPSQIIRDGIINCNEECRVYLPNKSAQKVKIKRVRDKNILKEPKMLSEINIPESLKLVEGENFILSDKSFNNQKIIILCTISNLKLLSEAECWLMDGTFKVVPNIFHQLFTIHGKINTEIVPLIYCLMTGKTTEIYKEFFYEVLRVASDNGINLNPLRIISDFEKASVTAAKMFFPGASYKGCLFHLGQILWRRIQKVKLTNKYGNKDEFSINMRMILSLAFVPPEDIQSYCSSLNNVLDIDGKHVLKWFRENYITGRTIGGKFTSPKYPTTFWSIADAVEGSLPRTQNSLEAWHRRLQIVVGRLHVGLYKIIQELSKEHIVVKSRITKMKAGERPIRKKIYVEKEKN